MAAARIRPHAKSIDSIGGWELRRRFDKMPPSMAIAPLTPADDQATIAVLRAELTVKITVIDVPAEERVGMVKIQELVTGQSERAPARHFMSEPIAAIAWKVSGPAFWKGQYLANSVKTKVVVGRHGQA
jgi:hypothetical protein